MVDASGNSVWIVAINGTNVGFAYMEGAPPAPGDTFTPVNGRDGDTSDSGDGVSSTESYGNIICFTPGAAILTDQGNQPIETLNVGAHVVTIDAGLQPICWMSQRWIDFRRAPDTAKPILIKAGAFCHGQPRRDMIVSPQHRFVFEQRDGVTSKEVFVPAKSLIDLPGVRVMQGKRSVVYIHMALKHHHVVIAKGVRTETCYIAAPTLAAASTREHLRLQQLFPNIDASTRRGYGRLARPTLRVRDVRMKLASGRLDSPVHASAGITQD